MRQDIAHKFDEILTDGNFNSTLINYNNTEAVKIEHEVVCSELGVQHIQEFLDQQIEEDTEWFFEHGIENVSEFRKYVNEDYTLLY